MTFELAIVGYILVISSDNQYSNTRYFPQSNERQLKIFFVRRKQLSTPQFPRLSYSMKAAIKRILLKFGWSVRRSNRTPAGIDWPLDIKRWIPDLEAGAFFDVGANVGQTALCIHERFPTAVIHSFEPIPETFETLTRRMSRISNVRCNKFAMGAEEKNLKIRVVPNHVMNSLETGLLDNHPDAKEVVVEVKTVDQYCIDNSISKIDILKTDTEGYDLEVLKGASNMLKRGKISGVLSEVTFDEENSCQSQFSDILEYLSEYNFLPCGFYETHYLMRTSDFGSFCNALFVRRDVLPRVQLRRT